MTKVLQISDHGWSGAASAEAVAEGLQYFLRCPQERVRAGTAALASAERYSAEQFGAAWHAVFVQK